MKRPISEGSITYNIRELKPLILCGGIYHHCINIDENIASK